MNERKRTSILRPLTFSGRPIGGTAASSLTCALPPLGSSLSAESCVYTHMGAHASKNTMSNTYYTSCTLGTRKKTVAPQRHLITFAQRPVVQRLVPAPQPW
jgi:hypothetical protein